MVSVTRDFSAESVTNDAASHEPITFGSYRGSFTGSSTRSIQDGVMAGRNGSAYVPPDGGGDSYFVNALGYWYYDNSLTFPRYLTRLDFKWMLDTSASTYDHDIFGLLVYTQGGTLDYDRSSTSSPWTFRINGDDTTVECPQNTELRISLIYTETTTRFLVNNGDSNILDETVALSERPVGMVISTTAHATRNFAPGDGHRIAHVRDIDITLAPYIGTYDLGSPWEVDQFNGAAIIIDGDEGVLAVSAGALPPGVSLNPDDLTITGTPTVAGTYDFTLTYTEDESGATASHIYSLVVTGGTVPIPDSPPPTGWQTSLNGSVMDGGGYEGDADMFLLVPPDGLGLPDLRVSDQAYPQRDGVDHFTDWYGPRILTFTGVIGDSGCQCSGGARQHAANLTRAWQRTCDDTELVLFPPCYDAIAPTNLVSNPSFTVDTSDWLPLDDVDLVRDTTKYHSAPASARINATAPGANVGMTIQTPIDGVTDNSTYRFEAYSRAESYPGAPFFFVAWEDADGNITYTQSVPATNNDSEWTLCRYEVQAPAGTVRINAFSFIAHADAAGDEYHYVDDVSLIDITGSETLGPFGVRGRPRVAQLSWRKGKHQIADVTTRFDANDQRLYILDADGTPGSGSLCATLENPVTTDLDYYKALIITADSDFSAFWPLDFLRMGAWDPTTAGGLEYAHDLISTDNQATVWGGNFTTAPFEQPKAAAPLSFELGMSSLVGPAVVQAPALPSSYTTACFGWWQQTEDGMPCGTMVQVGAYSIGRSSVGGAPSPEIRWNGTNVAMNADCQAAFGFTDDFHGEPVLIVLTWTASVLNIYAVHESNKATGDLKLVQSVNVGGKPTSQAFQLQVLGKVQALMYGTGTAFDGEAITDQLTASVLSDPSLSALTLPDLGSACVPIEVTFAVNPAGTFSDIYIFRDDGQYVGLDASGITLDNPSSLSTETGTARGFFNQVDFTDRIIGDPFMLVEPGETLNIFGAAGGGDTSITVCFRPAVLSA